MRERNRAKSMESWQSFKLRGSGFFGQLSPSCLKEFDRAKSYFDYPSGAVLFHENQKARGVFVLCSGELKLSICSSKGKSLILRVAKPGDAVGLASTLTGNPFEVTATATRACTIIFVPRDKFLSFIATHPEANAEVLRQLCISYLGACDHVRAFGLSSSVPERLARLLLSLSDEGQVPKECARGKTKLTHEEIAEFIGSSREAVTRTLSEFKHRRFVVTQGSALMVSDRAALESMVQR